MLPKLMSGRLRDVNVCRREGGEIFDKFLVEASLKVGMDVGVPGGWGVDVVVPGGWEWIYECQEHGGIFWSARKMVLI